ncbi:MAG: hypothetical protein IPG72_03980 [Ardenticatenales bacterium]|nr:hypothetical protein [Ardenticatenales bacterium]
MTLPAPALLRAGRPSATAAGALRLRGRRLHVAALVSVSGDEAGRDGHEAALVATLVDALATASGSTTARMRTAILAADAALRARAASQPPGARGLTAAVSVAVADGDEVLLAEVGSLLAFASSADGLPVGRAQRRGLDGVILSDDPMRPPLGRPGQLEPILHWTRWEPSGYRRGLVLLLATADADGTLSEGVVAALFATPIPRWAAALSTAVSPPSAAVVVAFAQTTPAPAPAPTPTTTPEHRAPMPVPVRWTGAAADRSAAGNPVDAAVRRGARSARDALSGVPWRAVGGRAGRSAARLFLALFPRRLESRDRTEWSRLLATAAVLLPPLVLIAALAVLARQPGGIRAGFDRLRQSVPSGDATGAGPDGMAPAGGAAAIGGTAPLGAAEGAVERAPEGTRPGTSNDAGSAGAAVPVATMAPIDPAQDAGMVRLTDAAGVARVQGADSEPRRMVAVGEARYVLNVANGVVEAVTAAGVLPALQSGVHVNGQPVGDLIDLAWLPLAGGTAGGAAGQVVALDATGRLWAIEGVAARPLAVAGGLAQGTRAIGGYDGSLYGVDTANGISRYAAAPGPSFAAAEAWLTERVDLAQATDMAIDGTVFVLLPGGAIRRFSEGEPAPFTATDVPGGLDGTLALYTSPTAGRVLVADAARGRIVALGADGAFEAQHALPILPAAEPGSDDARGRIRALQGVFWDEGAAELWWLSGGELYRAGFRR